MKRTLTHELMAEFFGTFVLILGGDGVVANVGLAPRLASQGYDWNTIVWGWGLSVMVAVYVAGGVSGAHINPAVTFGLAVKRGFPWSKVGPYMLAQLAGAFVGAIAVYLVYRDGLVEAGMPNVWATGPGSVFGSAFWGGDGAAAVGSYSMITAFLAEVFGTMMLMWGILGWGDSSEGKGYLGGLIVGLVVVTVGLVLGGPSGYAINPARDLGPRLWGLIAGTDGLFGDLYWLVVPIIGPLVGGALAPILYDIFITPGLKAEVEPAETVRE
ncbi:MAG: MIP/aquaporin family protein [Candidatus Promineifilaceae bacterium]